MIRLFSCTAVLGYQLEWLRADVRSKLQNPTPTLTQTPAPQLLSKTSTVLVLLCSGINASTQAIGSSGGSRLLSSLSSPSVFRAASSSNSSSAATGICHMCLCVYVSMCVQTLSHICVYMCICVYVRMSACRLDEAQAIVRRRYQGWRKRIKEKTIHRRVVHGCSSPHIPHLSRTLTLNPHPDKPSSRNLTPDNKYNCWRCCAGRSPNPKPQTPSPKPRRCCAGRSLNRSKIRRRSR